MVGTSTRRSGKVWYVISEVRVALVEVRVGSGDPPRGPVGVGRPVQRSGRAGRPCRRSWRGREACPEVRVALAKV